MPMESSSLGGAPIELNKDAKSSARSDLVSGLFWMVAGSAIVVASARMDRLEHLGATIYTAPGLVPGLLGLVITLFGVLLGLRALRDPAGLRARGLTDTAANRRVWWVLGLCLTYAAFLIAQALPFKHATVLFVATFVAVFEYPLRRERGEVWRGLVMALVYGVATGAAVHFIFESLFYVRLP